MSERNWFLCVCEREWCWCTNRVPTLDTPCFMCLEGAHQEAPDPIRPAETDEEPWFPDWLEQESPAGCWRAAIVGGLLTWAVIIAIIWVIRRLVA